MLELKIKNNMLNETIDFFYGISLKGKESRMRTRFIKDLSAKIEEIVEEESEILKEHCELDDDGQPKKNDDDSLVVKKGQEQQLLNERLELHNEEYIIDDSNSQQMLMTLREILDNYDGELSGREAVFYDFLCEQFKVDESLEEDE